jgi:hypothetical protein
MSNAERQAKHRRKHNLEAQLRRAAVKHLKHRIDKLEDSCGIFAALGFKRQAPPGDVAEIEKLIKILGLLGSSVPGERASAALKVDETRQRLGFTWEGLFEMVALAPGA